LRKHHGRQAAHERRQQRLPQEHQQERKRREVPQAQVRRIPRSSLAHWTLRLRRLRISRLRDYPIRQDGMVRRLFSLLHKSTSSSSFNWLPSCDIPDSSLESSTFSPLSKIPLPS
ncbi:hypothetical protein PFISCL1PPCAC_24953, partial [Pristionchus fissidentatus]